MKRRNPTESSGERPVLFSILILFFLLLAALCPAFSAEEGEASWYGGKFQGRQTANGEIFDTNKFTAAHRTLPFNTHVRVTNLDNGRSTVVRVNDRGPFIQGRIIDLSKAAAESLDMIHSGTARVSIEVIKNDDKDSGTGTRQRSSAGEKITPRTFNGSSANGDDPLAAIPLPEPKLPEILRDSGSETYTRTADRKGGTGNRNRDSNDSRQAFVKNYIIQVGSFSMLDNALRLKEYLEARGFTPRFERASEDITRVIIPDIVPVRLAETTDKLHDIGIMEYLIREVH